MPGRCKSAVARTLHAFGADALLGRLSGRGSGPLILGYHRVVENYAEAVRHSLPPMLIAASTLEMHLDWLATRYQFVTLDEAAASDRRCGRAGKPLAAVTFDDGYCDFYDVAFPLLQRKGIPAAVFVVTDLTGTDRLQIHDEVYLLLRQLAGEPPELLELLAGRIGADPALCARIRALGGDTFRLTRALLGNLSQLQLRRLLGLLREYARVPDEVRSALRSLDWETLRRLHGAGIVVGSHTRSHAFLLNEPLETVIEEAVSSKLKAETMLGAPVRHIAYPDGQFSAVVLDVVQEAGYRYGYTTCRHRDPMRPHFTVPRRVLWEKSTVDTNDTFSPAVMSCQVHGVFDLRGRCTLRHGI
jgi:peptidoglycan/xylan/chitin deacetylase (PgdA/CDA1 family)